MDIDSDICDDDAASIYDSTSINQGRVANTVAAKAWTFDDICYLTTTYHYLSVITS